MESILSRGTPADELRADRGTLAEELRALRQLIRAHRLQHHRAPYFRRVVECHKLGVEAATPPADDAADAIERALHAIAPAWLELRRLLAQSYFMPYALAHLAVLSRVATLLAEQHPSGRGAAALLALRADAQRDAALARVFGAPDAAAAALPEAPPPPANDGDDSDDDDVGEAVPPLAAPDEQPARRPPKRSRASPGGTRSPRGRGYSSLLAVCSLTRQHVRSEEVVRTAYTATGSVVVRTEMTANGTADDYDAARKRKIAEAFAAEVDGADADDVRVHVILIVDKAV